MRTHARVVVIGGGVVGASVLYHLTKAGWKDVLLIERAELTSGSTWHAAGGMHTVNGDPNVAKLQQYTIELYKELERISGQSCGMHITGGLMLAGTADRVDWLKMAQARGRYLGMDLQIISASEAKKMYPLLDERQFLGAIYDPIEGHVDPYGVTHAYAKAAQIGGAEIVRQTRVVDTKPRPDGSWDVITAQGNVHAEHIVNAGGLWAREVGRFVGLELPVLAMEHQYLITEDLPELKGQKELLHVIDFEGEIYMRQERGGILLGTYERAGVPWSARTTPWDFGQDLLPQDLDRIAPSLEVAFEHFPRLATAGVRRVINGPFTFAPDGNPLLGPIAGLRNYWVACGVMAGFSQGGGVGLSLAQWIVEGDPGADIWAMDVARYGDWTTLAYTNAKVRENYSRRFRIRFPNEELPAARPLRTTSIHDRLVGENAVMGEYCGLEHALWFAPQGTAATEQVTFRRSNAHAAIAAECRAVQEGVGLLEISNYGKFEVSGAGSAAWLASIMAGRVPKVGRISLTPMLNERGRLIGDFTLCRRAEEHFFVVGTYAAEAYYRRWFERYPPPATVSVRACAMQYNGLSLAGPAARELLQPLVDLDLSMKAFPFMSFAGTGIGLVPALLGRVSFTGDIGYEIWVTSEYQAALYELLVGAGRAHGLKLIGGRALNSMRLEKSFGTWAREFRPIYGPFEAGLGRFIDLARGDFVGRAAALEEQAHGGERRLITLDVQAHDADAVGDEPIWHHGQVVGWVTSGGYGHRVGKSLALGYVRRDVAGQIEGFEVELIGERRPALRLAEPAFDPQGLRMRAYDSSTMLTRRELLAGSLTAWLLPAERARAAGEELLALPGKRPLIKRSFRPPNYETPLADLRGPYTSNDAFFVRYHLANIPVVDTRTWRLRVGGASATRALELSLADLQHRYEHVTVAAVNQCAGNRRGLFTPRVPGVQWTNGAMGNAHWTGVRLRDVLRSAGIGGEALEVVFDGADTPLLAATPDFIKSLPIDRALDENTLIAFEMNGRPLPHWNGAPARLVVPGWVATYWVKQLTDIRIESRAFDGFWMKTAYRVPTGAFPGVRFTSQETPETTPVTEIPVNSLITSHENGARLPRDRRSELSGWAWDSGSGIASVDISTDAGQSWRAARLERELGPFAWRGFRWPLDTSKAGPVSILARAVSRAGARQPERLTPNPSGYYHNLIQSLALEIA